MADDHLSTLRDYWGAYHHHKEQMAVAAATFYLAATTTVVFKAPEIWAAAPCIVIVVLLLSSTVLAFLFVRWQLGKRETAAGIVEACSWLIRDHQSTPEPDSPDETWRGVPLPKAVINKLKKLESDKRFLSEPRKAQAIILIAMVIWTVAAASALWCAYPG